MKTLFAMMLASLASHSVVTTGQNQHDFLSNFISGNYHLIGKSLNSEETYYGIVQLKLNGNTTKVTRKINGKTITGSATIEKTTMDKIYVLRMRFSKNRIEYEETCMIGTDLDNYARITCLLYRPGVKTDDPGLESLFILHDTK